MAQKVQHESAERLARPLIQLAHACGVSTSYIDQLGTYVENTDEAIIGVLAALDIDASSDESIAQELRNLEQQRASALVAPTVVATTGQETLIPINCAHTCNADTADCTQGDAHAAITALLDLEQGETLQLPVVHSNAAQHSAAFATTQPSMQSDSSAQYYAVLDATIPMGYHTLTVTCASQTAQATVLSAPASIPVPQAVQEHSRWGWMTQMYSVRSSESWGIGDYADLRTLAQNAAHNGADFMLINPIHASAPIPPLEPSPYLPESRRFLNVTYIRPQSIPEYEALRESERHQVDALHASVAAANTDPEPIDIDAAWDAKRRALRIIFDHGMSAERRTEYERFLDEAGADLDTWATWCVAFELWGAPWQSNPWFRTQHIHSPEVQELVREHEDLFDFNRWLQWIADTQITEAQEAAKREGMTLGLMLDMAVGVHDLGSDVWGNPERFALGGVTVGCPPDFYNQQGQDWGQPPFNPRHLEATGYATYREMVHSMFAHAGAVRIDHILGLFRLWWIPRGLGAKNGAYVTYNHEAMLAVLTIEATRANGMVIGEDLGTVPQSVRDALSAHGVLGTDVAWFTRVDNSPNAGDPYASASDYRKGALASVTTHDLPPTAGYLQFEHVALREQLHLLSEPVETFAASARAERTAMTDMLVRDGWLRQQAADDVEHHVQEVVEAMHAMLTATPSLLHQAALVDGTGERRTQNQPGTSTQYPNWRIPLTDEQGKVIPTDLVFSSPRVQSLVRIMNGKR